MKKPEILSDDELFKLLGIEVYCDELPFYKQVCQDQRDKDWEEIQEQTIELIEKIQEEFVVMVGNFYMTAENRSRAFELWKNIKKQVLK